ncbi:MAG: hypothetical protein WBG54_16085 [Acidobacteriaceae bacterium]
MMAPECSFILPNRKKCRCAALRHQTLCRHHAPRPANPGPPPIPKSELYSDLRRWRELGRRLQWMSLEEIPNTIWEILQCLVDRGPDASTGSISDLTAGRFLRALLNRLGDVPFPDPELVSESPSEPAPTDYNALFAVLGVPPPHAPVPQSRSRVNQ